MRSHYEKNGKAKLVWPKTLYFVLSSSRSQVQRNMGLGLISLRLLRGRSRSLEEK